jgi:uncharacterized membrane protein
MALPTKLILLVLGIILGIILSFAASDFEILLENKTQIHKDSVNLIARVTSIVSVGIFILTILKKIHVRPTWSYFVMGVAATYSIMSIVILPLLS